MITMRHTFGFKRENPPFSPLLGERTIKGRTHPLVPFIKGIVGKLSNGSVIVEEGRIGLMADFELIRYSLKATLKMSLDK